MCHIMKELHILLSPSPVPPFPHPPGVHQEAIHGGGGDDVPRREERRHVQRRGGHPAVLKEGRGALRLRVPGIRATENTTTGER